MIQTIAVIAPGAMGSAVAHRLVSNGAAVITLLQGRSARTLQRAQAAGMTAVEEADIAGADMILSILPPADALSLAGRLAPGLKNALRKPIYVDCNAVSPATVKIIQTVIDATGAPFADAAIIGGPPGDDGPGPAFYLAGLDASAVKDLQRLGLKALAMDGPIGAASSLKMSYAGLTKGLTAIGSAMLAAASRAGVGDALVKELAESQPALLKRFERQIPDMYPKAYRWVEEMRQISDFLGPGDPAHIMFDGAAAHYQHLASEVAEGGETIKVLDALMGRSVGR